MIHYSLQVIVFQLIFIVIYDAFLKRETFFNNNRAYLIITNALSLVLPLIKIERLGTIIPPDYIGLPEINVNNNTKLFETANDSFSSASIIFTIEGVIYIGMFITLVIFLYKLTKLTRLISKSPKRKTKIITVITLLNSNAAFSFFRYVFIGEQLNEKEKQSIMAHESIHVKEKHSIDLIIFELQRILFWFNPFVYIYQNRVATLHEYIADNKVIKTQNKKYYYENLLAQVFSVKNISFINPFFKKSLIKKRIIMLSKSKSKKSNLIKYLLLIPAITSMLFYSACSNQNSSQNQTENVVEEVEAIDLKKIEGSIPDYEVAFAMIENPPIFPGCENEEDQKKCFSDNIKKLVGQNFNKDVAKGLDLVGVQKISVFFKIAEDGSVKEIKSLAPHPDLEKEAIRIVGLLPKVLPGTHRGQAVTVPYYLPIIFEINE